MVQLDPQHPLQSLVGVFAAWKSFLLAVAIGSSVGPAYDTSSTLTSPLIPSPNESAFDIATKLTRWDAIYFIQASRRGYLFEQEWAFGSGLPTVISFITEALTALGFDKHAALEPLAGIFISHACHLLSVLVLYHLGVILWGNKTLSFTAALLHILSPAGLFLSAPYNESVFAFLSFLAHLFFAKGVITDKRKIGHDVSLVAAGMWFGFATTFRSNGILGGLLFAVELLRELSSVPNLASLRKRLALIIGGSAVALGFAMPQFVAYRTFCSNPHVTEPRPWCTDTFPSIYSFVQASYWNVGFLRYWTPGNIPLFLLATPVIYLLMKSGMEMLKAPMASLSKNLVFSSLAARECFVRSVALSQLILAALAVTHYHVQVITRISSGYPLWCFWLASKLGDAKGSVTGRKFVIFMVMYATIQGALFASFLPPA